MTSGLTFVLPKLSLGRVSRRIGSTYREQRLPAAKARSSWEGDKLRQSRAIGLRGSILAPVRDLTEQVRLHLSQPENG